MNRRTAFLLAMAVAGFLSEAVAQEVRTVEVQGRAVRVQTLSPEGEGVAPTVVFEAGFMYEGLLAWTPIVEQVAEFAPVVAYDRAGVGKSEPDGERPTPRHVAENLHALLAVLEVPTPYVLVGHSLGGVFIRMYAELYPEEVAGLVYIDPTPWMSADEMREYDGAMGISVEGRKEYNASVRQGFDDLPTPSIRAEAELIYDQQEAGWPEFQDLRPMPHVPVTVLMTSKFDPDRPGAADRDCAPRQCHERRIAYRRVWLADLADEVPDGTFIVINNRGHFIQYEDPELTVWAIRRVVEASRMASGQWGADRVRGNCSGGHERREVKEAYCGYQRVGACAACGRSGEPTAAVRELVRVGLFRRRLRAGGDGAAGRQPGNVVRQPEAPLVEEEQWFGNS